MCRTLVLRRELKWSRLDFVSLLKKTLEIHNTYVLHTHHNLRNYYFKHESAFLLSRQKVYSRSAWQKSKCSQCKRKWARARFITSTIFGLLLHGKGLLEIWFFVHFCAGHALLASQYNICMIRIVSSYCLLLTLHNQIELHSLFALWAEPHAQYT